MVAVLVRRPEGLRPMAESAAVGRWIAVVPRLATVAVVAVLIGGAAVLAGYVAEWQGWHGVIVGLSVAWLVGAIAFVAAVLVSSRRSGRPFWRVAWDGVRGLLRFIFETW